MYDKKGCVYLCLSVSLSLYISCMRTAFYFLYLEVMVTTCEGSCKDSKN